MCFKGGNGGNKYKVNEFTVAPQISPVSGLPYHEWFIEFENEPEDDATLEARQCYEKQNMYYDDLIIGNILQKAVISKVIKTAFKSI
jgi:hypothetical protein